MNLATSNHQPSARGPSTQTPGMVSEELVEPPDTEEAPDIEEAPDAKQ